MTRRRAVFVDVDGTLVTHDSRVPASAVAAVQGARANGHLVFLCTGRARSELWPALDDIGFDGFVGAAGAYVAVGDEVLVHHGVPDADLRHALDYFAAHDTGTYLQSDAAIHATPAMQEWLREVLVPPGMSAEEFARGPFGFVERMHTDGDLTGVVVTKVLYLDCPVPLAELRAEFAGAFDIVPSSVPAFGPRSGEMMLPGIHKAAGLDAVVAHLGLDRADTIAIGDSHNDLELLQHAGVGIAMGNAVDAVKAVADEVTADIEHDGLALAFARHGLA